MCKQSQPLLCLPNETFAYLKLLVLQVNSIHFCFSSLTKKETDQIGLHLSMAYKCIKYTINAVSVADLSIIDSITNYDPGTGGRIVGILTNQIFPKCKYQHSYKSCLVTTHPCNTFLFLFFCMHQIVKPFILLLVYKIKFNKLDIQ